MSGLLSSRREGSCFPHSWPAPHPTPPSLSHSLILQLSHFPSVDFLKLFCKLCPCDAAAVVLGYLDAKPTSLYPCPPSPIDCQGSESYEMPHGQIKELDGPFFCAL